MRESAAHGMHGWHALGAWLAFMYICALGKLCRKVLPLGQGEIVSRETRDFETPERHLPIEGIKAHEGQHR